MFPTTRRLRCQKASPRGEHGIPRRSGTVLRFQCARPSILGVILWRCQTPNSKMHAWPRMLLQTECDLHFIFLVTAPINPGCTPASLLQPPRLRLPHHGELLGLPLTRWPFMAILYLICAALPRRDPSRIWTLMTDVDLHLACT